MDQSWIQSPFLDPIRRAIRIPPYSIRTEQCVGHERREPPGFNKAGPADPKRP